MLKSDSVYKIDNEGTKYQIGNVEYGIDKWDFSNDGMYGHIYFTVPKGIYEYASNNGAYCYNKDNDSDGIHVATPCCFVYPNENISNMPLSEIFKEAIVFADFNLYRIKK